MCSAFLQYSVPVIKYDRNGFKPRPRQLILTQTAAYVIEEAKIKQRVLYTTLKGQDNMIYISLAILDVFLYWAKSVNLLIAGISVSNLTDGMIVFHITDGDPKQKVCEADISTGKWSDMANQIFIKVLDVLILVQMKR